MLLKFGLKKPTEKAQTQLSKYGLSGIFLSYWQPNLAALASTAAGILQFPFKKFILYSATAAILWNMFWGVLVYVLGEAALTAIGARFVMVVIILWIAYRSISKKNYTTSETRAD